MNSNKYIYRHNLIDIAPQALLLAAGIVLSVVLVSIMVTQFKAGKEMVNIAGERILDVTEDIKQSEILQYDGLTVNGADVINFCKKHLGEYTTGEKADITVNVNYLINGRFACYSYRNSDCLSAIRNPDSEQYIKPVTRWKCEVVKNKNGIITEINFKSQ